MTVHHQNDFLTLHHGECLDVLRTLPDESVHTVVTDPPYGLSDVRSELVTAALIEWATGDRTVVPDARGFMGNRWDSFVPPPAVWDECMRVLKPGGHVLAFAGSRTYDLMGLSIRLAGFDIRDGIAWLYASGMPKSMDVAKAIDKLDAARTRRDRALEFTAWIRECGLSSARIDEITGTNMGGHFTTAKSQPAIATAELFDLLRSDLPEVPERIEELVRDRTVESENYAARQVTGHHERGAGLAEWRARYDGGTAAAPTERRDNPFTPEAARWQGWGTGMKPAFEPIVVARKPFRGTVAANVMEHGTGALNIDATRIPMSTADWERIENMGDFGRAEGHVENSVYGKYGPADSSAHDGGRWAPNVELDAAAAALLDAESGVLKSGKLEAHHARAPKEAGVLGAYGSAAGERGYGDEGGASRFFPVHETPEPDEVDYCADCNGEEAEPVDVGPDLPAFLWQAKAPGYEKPTVDGVKHPTVKPLTLMQRMVRLVTPPGGTVLEPFAGSGTTVEAVLREGFHVVAIEREADYLPLIMQRVKKDHPQSLFGDLFDEDGAA